MIFSFKSQDYKASSADTRTKVKVIKENSHRCSISLMYDVLKLSRGTSIINYKNHIQ